MLPYFLISFLTLDVHPGHVNNVTYVRYAESARVNWTRNIGTHLDIAHKKEWWSLLNNTGIGLILRSIRVDYKFVRPPERILQILTSLLK